MFNGSRIRSHILGSVDPIRVARLVYILRDIINVLGLSATLAVSAK